MYRKMNYITLILILVVLLILNFIIGHFCLPDHISIVSESGHVNLCYCSVKISKTDQFVI